MKKIDISIVTDPPHVTMKGSIDLEHYCTKCECNEFFDNDFGSITCAQCGTERDYIDGGMQKTKWEGIDHDTKMFVIERSRHLNKTLKLHIFKPDAYSYQLQKDIMAEWEKNIFKRGVMPEAVRKLLGYDQEQHIPSVVKKDIFREEPARKKKIP